MPPTNSRSASSAAFISAGARTRAVCQPTTATIEPSAMPVSWYWSLNAMVTLPIPMMIPAASGTRLIGLAKSTRFSFQIFAPSRPIIP